ncbi:MAG: rod shape-determining protein MreC [Rhodothermaceae bacterium]
MRNFFNKIIADYKEYIILVVLLLISLGAISLNEKSGIRKIRTYAFGSFAFLSNITHSFGDIFVDDSELAAYRKRNAELMLQINQLREFGIENNELKKLLEFKDTTSYPLIPATIISKSVSKLSGDFIVNSGRTDSVKIGMPAINHQGLVGIVVDVSEDFSVIRTLQNHNLKIAVEDQRSGVNGVFNWDGKKFSIKNIPTTYDIKKGDRIVTSAFSTIVPPSIPIGIVAVKDESLSGILSNVVIQPFVNFNSLKHIFILDIIQKKQIDSYELNLITGN